MNAYAVSYHKCGIVISPYSTLALERKYHNKEDVLPVELKKNESACPVGTLPVTDGKAPPPPPPHIPWPAFNRSGIFVANAYPVSEFPFILQRF